MGTTAIFNDHNGIMITSIISAAGGNLYDTSAQGMKRNVNDANVAAQKIAQGEVTPDNFTALIQADISLKANHAVAVTADEMVGSLLNRKA